MNSSEIIEALRKNKPELRSKFHISGIGLFGSYSKGRQHLSSDIDLVYELEEGRFLGFKEMEELETYLHSMLNERRIDLVNKRYMNQIVEDEMEKSVIYV